MSHLAVCWRAKGGPTSCSAQGIRSCLAACQREQANEHCQDSHCEQSASAAWLRAPCQVALLSTCLLKLSMLILAVRVPLMSYHVHQCCWLALCSGGVHHTVLLIMHCWRTPALWSLLPGSKHSFISPAAVSHALLVLLLLRCWLPAACVRLHAARTESAELTQ